jgi:hypothetical protein
MGSKTFNSIRFNLSTHSRSFFHTFCAYLIIFIFALSHFSNLPVLFFVFMFFCRCLRRRQSTNQPISAQRSVVLLPDLPMPFIKALKNAASSHPSVGGKTTVNDVLSACLAGAVRRYCVMEKDPLLLKDGVSSGRKGFGTT